MATTLVFAIALIFQHGVESIETPYGLCFVPTKHTEARGELSTPLISPQSPGYKQAYNDFIEPMLKEISDTTGIFTKGAKNRLRSIKDNIEVYYSDNSQDPSDIENLNGIWDVSFGQLIFKFTEAIPGIPSQIIFNGLMPAVGIRFNKIEDWKRTIKKQTQSKPNEDMEEMRRRRMQESESEEDIEFEGAHKASKIAGHHSDIYFSQTITLNGNDKSKKLDLWVVHNDPNTSNAFAVAASTGTDLFSTDWKLHSSYCRDAKYGKANAYEEYGDCDGIREDIGKYVTKYLSKQSQYCKKVILCKNGAFKFQFKAPGFRGHASDFDKFHISAAKVTGDWESQHCEFKELVEIHVENEKWGSHRCPVPSIALDFKCHTHFKSKVRNMDHVFAEHQWYPKSNFWNRGAYQYRVIPPQGPEKNPASKWKFWKKREGENGENMEENENEDPFKCDSEKSGAEFRPRFQIKEKHGTIHTCCIRRVVAGEGDSIGYYWPDSMQTNIEDNVDVTSTSEKSADPHFWNAIPESAIIGKAPSELPKNIQDRVVGWRKHLGAGKQEAYSKVVTKEEYDAIRKNEGKVKDPANPNEHAISASYYAFNWNIQYLVGVSIILMLISSVYIVI